MSYIANVHSLVLINSGFFFERMVAEENCLATTATSLVEPIKTVDT